MPSSRSWNADVALVAQACHSDRGGYLEEAEADADRAGQRAAARRARRADDRPCARPRRAPIQRPTAECHRDARAKAWSPPRPIARIVSISAESRAKLPKVAQQQNAQAMTAVQERLKAAGISGDAVRTIRSICSRSSTTTTASRRCAATSRATPSRCVSTRSSKVGEVVDAAVSSGATSVSNIRFDLKDRQAVQQKALAEAVADARGRADALAKAAGVSINRIVRIEDQSEQHVPPPRPMAQFRMAAADAATTPVAAGQLEIRARVVLTVKVN